MRKICGVYKIVNKVNSKFYIGSSKDIKHRWENHRFSLRKNKHKNIYLQRAWNKYGEDNFEFEIIEECKEDKRLQIEQYYINLYKCYEDSIGYNISKDVNNTNISEKTRKKLSKSSSGENNHFSKLNKNEVLDIDNMLKKGYKVSEISEIKNIKRSTIQDIKTGRTWNHITDRIYEKNNINILSDNEALKIIDMLNQGYKIIDVSNILKINYSKISDISRGKTWGKYSHLLKEEI